MNINRRNFIKSLLTATAGFNILPPATTYDRIWRATPQPILITPNNLFDWFWYDTDGTRHEVWEHTGILKHVSVMTYREEIGKWRMTS